MKMQCHVNNPYTVITNLPENRSQLTNRNDSGIEYCIKTFIINGEPNESYSSIKKIKNKQLHVGNALPCFSHLALNQNCECFVHAVVAQL